MAISKMETTSRGVREMNKEEKIYQLTMSYEEKVKRSKELILEWYLQYQGKVYVSFSGGKDSTVLLHLVRNTKYCENVKGVFCNTGLEYPEIREFVKKQENITWLKPELTFKQVIEQYGYPIISKEQAGYIYEYRNSKSEKLKEIRLNGKHWHIAKRWKPLINSDFKISNRCCEFMKKRPFHKYEKQTGEKPMLGIMAQESKLRYTNYMHGNCNAFSSKRPKSTPLAFWNEQDILRYIKENKLEICSVYGDVVEEKGELKTTMCNRTGCMFCMFGVHLEKKNRFEMMKETHPKLYYYIMNKLDGKHVLSEYLKCDKKCSLRYEADLFEELEE